MGDCAAQFYKEIFQREVVNGRLYKHKDRLSLIMFSTELIPPFSNLSPNPYLTTASFTLLAIDPICQ